MVFHSEGISQVYGLPILCSQRQSRKGLYNLREGWCSNKKTKPMGTINKVYYRAWGKR